VFSQPALLLLLAGFGIKAGALSLHFWLPLAHPAAPVPASAVLSGAMLKAGLLGWIRFLPLARRRCPCRRHPHQRGPRRGGARHVRRRRAEEPKTVLAYSSISQMGIITTGIGIGALRPESCWTSSGPCSSTRRTTRWRRARCFWGSAGACGADSAADRHGACGVIAAGAGAGGCAFTSGALAKVALKGNVAFLPGGWADVLGILLPLAAVGTALKMARSCG